MKLEQWQWSVAGGWKPGTPSEATGLGASAQIVFIFGNVGSIEGKRCFEVLRASYPHAHLFGCTTAGEIQGTHVTDDTVAITAIAFEDTRVVPVRAPILSMDRSFEAGEQLARSLDTRDLRHILILSEGLQVNASDLVQGINSVLPAGISVSGGFAGDGNRFQETSVWCDDISTHPQVAALAFYGARLRVGVAASAGWDPFGPDRLITKSKDTVLYEFDGQPALGVYKQYLGEYAQKLPTSGLLFPLALRVGNSQQRVLRALLAVDEAEQSITFAGNMPQGAYARLMRGRIEHVIDGARIAATDSIIHPEVSAPQFSLLISCNGRRPVLKQRIEEEVEVVSTALGKQTILTGFYSYGEIAPTTIGSRSELHNETMTVTSFTEV